MQEQTPVGEKEVGVVIHYWTRLGVAGVHLDAPLSVGDRIHVVGHTSDFEQDVISMEIGNEKVSRADPGQDVGLEMVEHARENDRVFKKVQTGDIGTDQLRL